MGKWITDWPHGRKWGRCSPAFAVQVLAAGRCRVLLVDDAVRVTRHILATPIWAQTVAQRSRAVALAQRLAMR